jgi:hypothetical protein
MRAAVDIAEKHGYAYVYHHPYTDVFFVRKELLPADLAPVDITKTYDSIPLHSVDTKFKHFVYLNVTKDSTVEDYNYD